MVVRLLQELEASKGGQVRGTGTSPSTCITAHGAAPGRRRTTSAFSANKRSINAVLNCVGYHGDALSRCI